MKKQSLYLQRHCKNLRTNNYIQKFSAALLLLVFCFGATPKEFLHSWFANHKDFQFAANYQSHTKDGLQHVNTSYFNCHCDNLVVESPFTNDVESNIFFVASTYITLSQKPFACLFSIPKTYFNLRGPPRFI